MIAPFPARQASTDAVSAWIPSHRGVDGLLYATVPLFLAFLLLAGACGAVYSALFLLRLLRPKNIANFLGRLIPSRIRGRFAGQELDISDELAEVLPAFERQTTETLERLERRLSKVERQLDLWEDVAGQA